MKRFLVIAALLGAAAAPLASQAQPVRLQQVQAGRPVPLSRVLDMISQQIPGRHLNTTMGDADGRPAYFVQWQTPDGRVVVIVVDAQSGRIIGRQ
ncbi:PepSY domain-containing protein [Phenylobacterium sp.]|jgi:uncharacterized membrane protein YkoI|uniref:PepSY domain-containing protein n=1 Tax=Phenylobacterium sp. TaxID=1871053 RepID=UPI002F93C72B